MKIKLEAELAASLYHGEEDDCYELVAIEYQGEWRWGVNYWVVIKDLATNKFFATICQEQTGDHYWNTFEGDGAFSSVSPIEFTEVVPKEVTTIKYVKVTD